VKELQERNKQIILKNQEENGETLEQHIPRDILNKAGNKEQKGDGDEEPKGAEEDKKLK
jgi:hypothetical protein